MALPNLDSLRELREFDPGGMLDLVIGFPEQCERAVELGNSFQPKAGFDDPKQIVVSGLGSSAIAGDMLRALLKQELRMPVITNRDYHLPPSVDENTLSIIISYSGNTEETLSAYNEARQSLARIICITSGGTLGEWAHRDETELIQIPGDMPARAALGYMFIPMLIAVEKLGIISGWSSRLPEAISNLRQRRKDYGPDVERDDNRAKELARDLYTRIPLFYGGPGITGVVATRWKDQLNLNSKMLAFSNFFPELNHNEIDGWETANMQSEAFAVVIIRNKDDQTRIADRIEITKTLIPKGFPLHDIVLEGTTDLDKMLSGIYLADFTSVYLAALNQVDPSVTTGVEAIKEELGKVGVASGE